MLKPVHVVLGVLGLLAAGAVARLAFVLLREDPVEPRVPLTPAPAAAIAGTYLPEPVGFPAGPDSIVTDLAVADLDGDGLQDIVVCDQGAQRTGWIRQAPRGVWTETWIGDPLHVPAKLAVCDLDHDGHLDVVVACRGRREPTDDDVGSLVAIENAGAGKFSTKVLLDRIPPVTQVRAVDLRQDGQIALVAISSGARRGSVWWLRPAAAGTWEKELLVAEAWPVAIAARLREPGQPELAVLDAAKPNTVRIFRRNPQGDWGGEVGWVAPRDDWSGTALDWVDLNHDGRPELVLASGDRLARYPEPRASDGLQWISEGTADLHRIATLPGCGAFAAADLNADGHMDFVAASTGNLPLDPQATWVGAWLAARPDSYQPEVLSTVRERVAAVALGDLDGNGVPVVVTGGYEAANASERSRVTLWRRRTKS